MIREAKNYLPDSVTVCQADDVQLPFPDNSFDFIVSFIILYDVVEWEKELKTFSMFYDLVGGLLAMIL